MKSFPAVGLACFALSASSLAWSSNHVNHLAELADLSLEQLTSIKVTSASRREERLVQAAASVFVITQEDIRRAGATSIPEALRLAPNLHVARADNNQYAISARGFNNVLANKLLVLIDGRTVYTPLFSGVFWEAQDIVLEDVERIEVISGPGATLWGANAVNGVINIISMPAADARGTRVKLGAGNQESVAALRHGGGLSSGGHYRAYLKYYERDGKDIAGAAPIGDDARRLSGGFRMDWGRAPDQVTMQGDAYRGEVDRGPMREYSGVNLLGRLTRTLGADASLVLQAYYDRTERRHENTFDETLDILDIEAQHSFKPVPGQRLIWGGGYRHGRDDVENSPAQAFIPPDRTLRWSNVFVQDEIEVARDLFATVGLKAERNPYTGTEWLPNLRLAWYPSRDSLVWGALSRAVRAPSRLDRELFFPGQPPFALIGSDAFESEVARVAELGYRMQLSQGISFSATLFHHDYPNLRSIGLVDGRPAFRNDIEGKVSGVEGWGSYRVMPTWRLSAGFVLQDIDRKVKPGRIDLGGMASLGNDVERTAMVRSSWSPTPHHDFDVIARYVGDLATAVPSYTAVNARAAWRPLPRLEVSLSVENLFDRSHIEWQNRGLMERSYFLRLIWQS